MKQFLYLLFLTPLIIRAQQTELKTSFLFLPKEAFESGKQNWSLAMGDLNKDGAIDLVTASRTDGRVNVHSNDGTGNFLTNTGYPAEGYQRALCLADLNGDEWLDAATVTVTGKLCILLNDGQGALVKKASLDVKGNLHDITPGDFNNDKLVDLAVVAVSERLIYVLYGDGKGGFKIPFSTVALSSSGRTAKVADLDGNGTQDLIAGCDDDRAYLYLNSGQPGKTQFTLHSTLKSGKSTWAMVAEDLNQDGKTDLAVIGYEDKNLYVHYNLGEMKFKSMPPITGGDHTFDMTTGDIDSDGKVDLAACSTIDFSILYFRNLGESFESMGTLASGNWNSGIASADFDKDGTNDLATASINDNKLNLHYNAVAYLRNAKTKPPFILGTVYEAGTPAKSMGKGVAVDLLDKNGTIVATVETDEMGRYTFDGKPGETYTIRVEYPGKESFRKTITMTSDNVRVNILLRAHQPYDGPPALTPPSPATSAVPQSGSTMSGFTQDAETGNPIPGAKIVVADGGGNVIKTVFADKKGAYSMGLPPGNYGVTTTASGYFYLHSEVNIPERTEMNANFALTRLQENASIVLQNILFDTGKSSLREESRREMDRLAAIMLANPGLYIELAGHTDDVGSAESNKVLSQERAESVVNYLMDNGVGLERLTPIGYGEEKPLVPNTTAENRQKNRRIECRVVKINR